MKERSIGCVNVVISSTIWACSWSGSLVVDLLWIDSEYTEFHHVGGYKTADEYNLSLT